MNPLCLAQPTPLVAPETFLIRLYLGKAKPQKLQRPGLLRNVGQRELEESILAPRRTKSSVRFFQYQKPSMLGLSLKGVSRVLGTSPGGGGMGTGQKSPSSRFNGFVHLGFQGWGLGTSILDSRRTNISGVGGSCLPLKTI